MNLRSDRNTWKLRGRGHAPSASSTHLNQHVCCTLLLAALFYRAIYSSVSCLICFVWRKVNLETEANWSQFGWSQAGVSAAATCVLLAASHSGRFTSHPDIMNIYLSFGVHLPTSSFFTGKIRLCWRRPLPGVSRAAVEEMQLELQIRRRA